MERTGTRRRITNRRSRRGRGRGGRDEHGNLFLRTENTYKTVNLLLTIISKCITFWKRYLDILLQIRTCDGVITHPVDVFKPGFPK